MPERSESYVALVRARFFARPFAGLALATLFALIGVAVFAPLLANDRPLYLRAVDRAGFESAQRTLGVVARELETELAAPERDAGAIERALVAFDLRVATLARAVGSVRREGGAATAVDRLARLAESAHALAARAPVAPAAPELTEVAAWRADVASATTALALRDADHPEGVVLAPASSFPAWAALSTLDGFALGAWSALALSLGAAWFARRGGSRRFGFALVLAFGGGGGLIGALASAVLADAGVAPGSALKRAATRGELVVERAVFAPIPFGCAETNLGEAQRAPSWWRAGSASEGFSTQGSPTRGSGAQGSGAQGSGAQGSTGPDSASASSSDGFAAAPRDVQALFGEPGLDSPWRHPFGTDSLGRDLVARCVWGARASLLIGCAVAAAVALVGTLLGALAGHFRGWIDAVTSRAIEVVQCVPSFFLAVLALALVRVEGASAALAVAAVIAVFGWTQIARLVRAEFLRSAELDWVLAARAVGMSETRLVCLHVLPNALSPAIVAAVFSVAGAILLESALSFLGVGLAEPWPSWGSVLGDAPSAHVWWTVLFPGLFLFVTVLAVHRAGEALREALDPRSLDPGSSDSRSPDLRSPHGRSLT